jgi:hypothetical protein
MVLVWHDFCTIGFLKRNNSGVKDFLNKKNWNVVARCRRWCAWPDF